MFSWVHLNFFQQPHSVTKHPQIYQSWAIYLLARDNVWQIQTHTFTFLWRTTDLWGLEVSKRWSLESDSRHNPYSLNSDVGRSHPKKTEANYEKRMSLCESLALFVSLSVSLSLYAHRITGENKYVLIERVVFRLQCLKSETAEVFQVRHKERKRNRGSSWKSLQSWTGNLPTSLLLP